MVPPPLSLVPVNFFSTIRNYSLSRDSALVETIDQKLFLVQYGFPDDFRVIEIEDSVFALEDEEEHTDASLKIIFLKNISQNNGFCEGENNVWKEQEYLIAKVSKNLKNPEESEQLIICKIKLKAANNKKPEKAKTNIGGEESDPVFKILPEVLMSTSIPLESFQTIQKMTLLPCEDGFLLVIFTNQNGVLSVLIPEDPEDALDEIEDLEMIEGKVKYIDWFLDADQSPVSVYINENDTLFLGRQKIGDDVTSFILEGEYLLYTMNTQIPYDHLFTQKISQIRAKTHAKSQANRSSTNSDWRVRNIEKGAKLVCVGNDKIVLQMPRGNLEGIFSRVFLLKTVSEMIDNQEYKAAFETLRKHKMSLSLLVDANPEKFKEFIESGRVLSELKQKQLDLLVVGFDNTFAKELRFLYEDEEFTRRSEESEKIWGKDKKVNALCETLLKQLQNEEFTRIKNEMVVFSKTEPPSLVEGLERIKKVKFKGESRNKTLLSHLKSQKGKAPHLSQQTFGVNGEALESKKEESEINHTHYKEILKYFCWLVDAEELFRQSLLIFDLELAVMVAEFTQKDPKDYLPYIEALKRLEDPLERKVRICRDLNRDTLALKEIFDVFAKKDQKIDENYRNVILEIIEESNLHAKGLEIFGNDKDLDHKIRGALAKKMIKGKDQKGAAEMYLSYENLPQALKCFEKILDWRNAISILKRMYQDDNKEYLTKEKAFFTRIKPKFEKLKSYKELSEISIYQGESPLKIAEILVRGHFFRDCKSTLTTHNLPNPNCSPEEVESFKREILLQASVIKNKNIELLANLTKWRSRLKTIKKDKRQKLEMIAQGIIPEDMEGSEHLSIFSQTTAQSASSTFSILTGLGMTGNKRRGKKPKNLIRRKVKEGSVYEEEWLAQSINAMELTFEDEKTVSHLLSLLVRVGEIKIAREILKEYRITKVAIENKGIVKTVLQEEFEKDNVEVFEIYSHIKEFDSEEISRGSKKIKVGQVLKKFDYLIRE